MWKNYPKHMQSQQLAVVLGLLCVAVALGIAGVVFRRSVTKQLACQAECSRKTTMNVATCDWMCR